MWLPTARVAVLNEKDHDILVSKRGGKNRVPISMVSCENEAMALGWLASTFRGFLNEYPTTYEVL